MNSLIPSRFAVFTAVLLKIQVLWYVVPCQLVVADILKDCTALIFSVKLSEKGPLLDWLTLTVKALCFLKNVYLLVNMAYNPRRLGSPGWVFVNKSCNTWLMDLGISFNCPQFKTNSQPLGSRGVSHENLILSSCHWGFLSEEISLIPLFMSHLILQKCYTDQLTAHFSLRLHYQQKLYVYNWQCNKYHKFTM